MTNACVIGMGRIGLPLALLLARANHSVTGIDTNTMLLNSIRFKNLSSINMSKENTLIEEHLDKNLFVTQDLIKGVSESEVVFVAIGTGVGSDGSPDLTNIFDLFEKISADPSVVKGKLFVLKSTLPIGTTRKIAFLIKERTGLRCGVDFFLVFCPERVLGDKALSEMVSLPKIIGGMESESSEKAAKIYATIGGKIVIVKNPEIAEMVKLLDNSYRQTLFAFSNDFALLAEKYNMNAYEVIKVANDNYPRNNIPFPSGGVGGYCLTKDPLYLEASFKEVSKQRGFDSVWFMARKTNDYMPIHMVNLLKQKLEAADRQLCNSDVLVCGIAYKENTDDIRNSHGLDIARRLHNEGANVLLLDPKVQEVGLGFKVVDNFDDEVLRSLDALVFTVKHDDFLKLNHGDHILRIVGKMRTPVVIDGWGIFQSLLGRKDVFYTSVGIRG